MKNSFYTIIILTIVILLTFSNCKDDDEVKLLSVRDSIENCTLPYAVSFFSDVRANDDVSYHWDFNDGNTSSDANPKHIFRTLAYYEVQLTVRNGDATDSKTILLNLQDTLLDVIPDFDFGFPYAHNMTPCAVDFVNFSQHATSFEWDFGDGTTSRQKNPMHVFTGSGAKDVTLKATCAGHEEIFTQQVIIAPAPTDLKIVAITLWMPDVYIGADLTCEVTYDIHSELTTIANIYSSPHTWVLNDDLFFFNGFNFDGDVGIYIYDDFDQLIYSFGFSTFWWRDNYYPTILTFENSDFAAEVELYAQ